MKIGICSTDFEPSCVEELFRKASGYGFDAMQFSYSSIGMDEIPQEISTEITDALCAASRQYGVEIVAVNATFNLIDTDRERLARNIRSIDAMCRANQRLGCRLLTLCTGSRSPESMWAWSPDNASPEAWQELACNIRPVVETARRYEMYLGVETEASNVVMTPELARRFLDQTGYEKLKIIADCANLFQKGQAHPQYVGPVIRHAFEQFGCDIVLAHGKDIAESDSILFAPTGQGIVDYDLFLSLLKQHGYKGPMVLHGIYDEALMAGCAAFMRQKLLAYGM
ncbi:sugar phosphate isomerase/epimerase family protein [Anaerotruncus colihominis]|uniref:sugar phosphate isomerase/epimerase family protein n=1 Tax=Anaerotruncus colihominis TaxID=169435 RepID=UPI000D7B75D8|nr:sugar phosphate isomerase/epimerase family protein [Anaerotruncus colihominis]PWM22234.1 MAG: hypothetical protein DBX97_00475 [Collinsella tanakaei]